LLEQTRRQINRLVEEIAKLSESDLPPTEYYGEFLQRVLSAVAAPAGAVWVRNPQGHLQLQYQVNIRQVGLDQSETDRQAHDELLRAVAQSGRAQLFPPHSGIAAPEEGKAAPGNPTGYVILLAPILVDKQVAGLVEVWQDADRNPNAQTGFLQFITRMAELASAYTRNHQLRQMVGQQTLWTQLEAFARQIHGSLNPMEVGYLVANEGRRLVDCDRVSVAQRRGKKTVIEAVSGADVVEKRSNLIRLMATLFDKVLKWGEKLIYQGTKDDSLPPDVLKALDAYLAESNSKVLVILPLKDEREKESKKSPRSGLMMECFDPAMAPEQLVARLEVVGRHATTALYNAAEYRRIPMRFFWMPLAKVQEGLGGKARAITMAVLGGIALLVVLMIFVPYPLKMEAKGQLLPKERAYIFSPVEGQIMEFRVEPAARVNARQAVVVMHDVQLGQKIVGLLGEIRGANIEADSILKQANAAAKGDEKAKLFGDAAAKRIVAENKAAELQQMIQRTHADLSRPGFFELASPIAGTVLDSTFKAELTNRVVKPNEPVLRIGEKDGRWEIELKIPQKHIGQILRAYQTQDRDEELDVDLVLKNDVTHTYRGKLARKDIGGEAVPNRDENNEAEPTLTAFVRIDNPPNIPEARKIPENMLLSEKHKNLLVTGVDVAAKVKCGNHAMGYSLFYGVWEFIYEKIVFWF
jgi:hypothetical protein